MSAFEPSSYGVVIDSRRLDMLQGLPKMATEPVVASVLGVSVAHLARLRRDGRGPLSETGVNGRVMYRRSQVLAWAVRVMEGR